MLCDKCNNRTICKYYDFLINAPIIVHIESCEKAMIVNTKTEIKNPNDNITLLNFKQPIDYSQLNMNQEIEEESNENEEKIFVDLSQQTEEKEMSISDLLLMEGDNNEK